MPFPAHLPPVQHSRPTKRGSAIGVPSDNASPSRQLEAFPGPQASRSSRVFGHPACLSGTPTLQENRSRDSALWTARPPESFNLPLRDGFCGESVPSTIDAAKCQIVAGSRCAQHRVFLHVLAFTRFGSTPKSGKYLNLEGCQDRIART